MKHYHILTINPGSTSTKIGVFKNEECLFEINVSHSPKQLEAFSEIWEQYNFRKEEIVAALDERGFDFTKLDAVVGRGGLVKAIPSGTYFIDQEMIEDARIGKQGHHASNLGCVIAYSIGWENNIPSFIVDPPAVNDLEPLARISGQKEFERNSLFHALNIFATARKYAKSINKKYEDLKLIVVHMGGGITVAALQNGKAINVNNGLYEGPFTPERSGSIPLFPFLEKALSGKFTLPELKKMIVGKGGLVSYFNTNDARDVEKMIAAGSDYSRLVFEAMAYRIAEEIGRRATNLKGEVDAVILTGGLAHSQMLTNWISERSKFIAPVQILPGELELQALAEGGLRVLRGEERPKEYTQKITKIGVIYWDNIDVYSATIKTIEEGFRQAGYVFRKENSNMTITYKNCKRKEKNVAQAAEIFKRDKTDLIIVIGTPAGVRLAEYIKDEKIPTIFTGIYSPAIISGFEKEYNKNFYATCYAPDINEQFENTILKEEPNTKQIGVLYSRGELQSEIQFDDIREYCKKANIEFIGYEIQETEDLEKAKEFLQKHNLKWVYLATSNFIGGVSTEALSVITNNFHTVCMLEDTVLRGGLIGHIIPWKNVSEAALDLALDILYHNNIKIKIVRPETKKTIINKETAKKLNFKTKNKI